MAKVALLGHGVVGSGVAEVLMKNAGSIAKRAGEGIEIKYILDIRDFPGLEYSDRFVRDYDVIEHDPEIEVVIEVIGGIKPAYEFVSRAILAGKSVVTSNKELVAARGAQLLELATQNGVKFLFEASVGGGIPIIRPMHQCLAANELDGITGILNGTTNYILTKMAKDHAPFDETLKMAQQLGYHTVFWSLAYVDWLQDDQPTSEQAYAKLIPRIHNGAVVLLHSTSQTNAAILDSLLTRWEEMGYSFGEISELFPAG